MEWPGPGLGTRCGCGAEPPRARAALAGPEQLLRNVVLFSWLLGRYREQGRVVRSVGKVGGHLPDREVGLDDPELDRKVQRGRWWRIGLSCAITKYNDQFCLNMG